MTGLTCGTGLWIRVGVSYGGATVSGAGDGGPWGGAMWIMTTDGFFSAVQKESSDPDTITVRSRSRGDLVNLLSATGLDRRILDTRGQTDYPFRVVLTRDEWASYLANAAARLDYDNFKSAVSKRNHTRATTYGHVWGELLSIERERSTTESGPS